MSERSRRGTGLTIGLDLGSKHSQAVVIDEGGEVVAEFRVKTRRRDLERRLGGYAGAVVVVEASGSSPWVSRYLEELGLEVVVSNPRKVRMIAHGEMKTDRHDAEHLARLGRADRKLLYPIQHRGQQAQRDLVLLRSRDGLVRARVQLVNQVRGFARSLGERLPSASTGAFARRMHEQGKADLFPGLDVLLGVIQRLTAEIRRMDRQIEQRCRQRYPETELLRQVPGVGPLTALGFVLTIEQPERFRRSRSVGAYLGLCPKKRQSGKRDPKLGISKTGDALLRRLLVGAAHYILGPFGPDTDLRRFGLRLAARGGAAGKKKAVVAVARKLAVLLHRLWITEGEYVALGYAS